MAGGREIPTDDDPNNSCDRYECLIVDPVAGTCFFREEVDLPRFGGCASAAGASLCAFLDDRPIDGGVDFDGDGTADWDGGATGAPPDPQCANKLRKDRERKSGGCGLGAELALALAFLASWRRRARSAGAG